MNPLSISTDTIIGFLRYLDFGYVTSILPSTTEVYITIDLYQYQHVYLRTNDQIIKYNGKKGKKTKTQLSIS